MYDYQGMVILATNQVWWTWEVEDVFRKVKNGDKMAMKNYAKRLHTQIDDLVVQVCLEIHKFTYALYHIYCICILCWYCFLQSEIVANIHV